MTIIIIIVIININIAHFYKRYDLFDYTFIFILIRFSEFVY